jgi:hypothetical protein
MTGWEHEQYRCHLLLEVEKNTQYLQDSEPICCGQADSVLSISLTTGPQNTFLPPLPCLSVYLSVSLSISPHFVSISTSFSLPLSVCGSSSLFLPLSVAPLSMSLCLSPFYVSMSLPFLCLSVSPCGLWEISGRRCGESGDGCSLNTCLFHHGPSAKAIVVLVPQ